MEGNARTWFTPKQRAELWERWRSGQCVADIARALARRNKSGVYRVLALHGGIAPTPRRRAPRALRLEEREEISRGIAAGRSIRQIAQGLGRSPSTVSREIRRNGGCSPDYIINMCGCNFRKGQDQMVICSEAHLRRILSAYEASLGIRERCAVKSSRPTVWRHCSHSNLGRATSSIRPDMIFGKDRM
jgi:DNA-binding CsgD family transcriptional regulator